MITPMRRTALLIAWSTALPLACGGDEPSISKSLEEAEKREAEQKAAEEAKKAAIKVTPKADKLEIPWSWEQLKQMPIGMKVVYSLSGTDAKGKEVTDTWTATLQVNTDKEAGASAYRESEKDSPLAKQVARHDWTKASPFFWVEKAETEVAKREKVAVPAGEFECVVVEQKGFFGAHITAWMIADEPGVYAKVVDHGNANEEEDPTELTYELESIDKPAK